MQSYVFPGNIDESIMQIGAQPFMYMRTDAFSEINKESEQILLDLIHCTGGRTIIYTGSGTGAMSAVVENYCTTKKKAFVIDGGSFGHRWFQLCEYYGVPVIDYTVPFAKDIDYSDLEKSVASEKPDVFLCQHHETSTGQLFDLKRISAICRKTGTSLVVDVISSFLAEQLDMNALGIDVAVTSTQKGLNLPPGAALVFLSENALKVDFRHNNYYLDFQDNLKNLERGQTPFSPATTIFMQINERMRRNLARGIDDVIDTTRQKALYFRELCARYGWEVPASNPANAITGFFVHRNSALLCSELQKHGIFIMPCGKPDFFRVSHMGADTCQDLDELASLISEIENRA